jgi:hypothetical protein
MILIQSKQTDTLSDLVEGATMCQLCPRRVASLLDHNAAHRHHRHCARGISRLQNGRAYPGLGLVFALERRRLLTDVTVVPASVSSHSTGS